MGGAWGGGVVKIAGGDDKDLWVERWGDADASKSTCIKQRDSTTAR